MRANGRQQERRLYNRQHSGAAIIITILNEISMLAAFVYSLINMPVGKQREAENKVADGGWILVYHAPQTMPVAVFSFLVRSLSCSRPDRRCPCFLFSFAARTLDPSQFLSYTCFSSHVLAARTCIYAVREQLQIDRQESVSREASSLRVDNIPRSATPRIPLLIHQIKCLIASTFIYRFGQSIIKLITIMI